MTGTGDLDWQSFFARYRPIAVRFASGLLKNEDLAEDLCQEASEAVYERATTGAMRFESQAHARTYLFRTIRTLAVDSRRQRARSSSREIGLALELPASDPSPVEALQVEEGRLDQARREMALEKAIGGLGSHERDLLRLRFLEGLTFREIAERSGSPISTLQARVEAALEKIRKRVGKADPDE